MKNNVIFLCFFTAALMLGVFPGARAAAASTGGMPLSVSVLASSSLTDVLTELVRRYSVLRGVTVSATYDAPRELAGAIEAGEPAGLLITEHASRLNDLKQQGLLDVFSITALAENRLVLAISSESPLLGKINRDQPLPGLVRDITARTLLVIPDPETVPAGIQAKSAMEKLGVWQQAGPLTIRAGSARQAQYLVAKGKTVGVLYYTDAVHNTDIEILAEIPKNLYDPVIYQAAVAAGENMPMAREFLAFLKSGAAKIIFREHGFSVM